MVPEVVGSIPISHPKSQIYVIILFSVKGSRGGAFCFAGKYIIGLLLSFGLSLVVTVLTTPALAAKPVGGEGNGSYLHCYTYQNEARSASSCAVSPAFSTSV